MDSRAARRISGSGLRPTCNDRLLWEGADVAGVDDQPLDDGLVGEGGPVDAVDADPQQCDQSHQVARKCAGLDMHLMKQVLL